MARSPIYPEDSLPIIEHNDRNSGLERVPGGCVVLARTSKIIWRNHRGYAFFEYFAVIKSFVFSMSCDIFFSLSFKLITTEIGCRWSSDFHLEINGEIFTISPNVRGGCVTLARNTSIHWRKDRGCGFPEYFVMTKKIIFR